MLDYANYRNFNYVNALVLNSLHKIPEDIDLVVGIPRSGLIVSTLIAEYTNRQSTDIFSYLAGVGNYKLNSGSYAPGTDYGSVKTILLVDDAMGVGLTMLRAREMVLQKYPSVRIFTCVAFVEPFSIDKVDINFTVLKDQFLPWSVLKRGISDACCDIDGVLTEDVPPGCDDDGDKYVAFLKGQRPKYRPDRKISTLVTGRLEKYRGVTEEWLAGHGIAYGRLVMCPCTTKRERDAQDMGKFKAGVLRESGLPLFIESNYREAKTIKGLNPDRCVYCVAIADYVV